MENLEKIKGLVESLSVDTRKAYDGNYQASIRARKTAKQMTDLLQELKQDILKVRKIYKEKKDK